MARNWVQTLTDDEALRMGIPELIGSLGVVDLGILPHIIEKPGVDWEVLEHRIFNSNGLVARYHYIRIPEHELANVLLVANRE